MKKKITLQKFEEMFGVKTCDSFYTNYKSSKFTPDEWKDKWDNWSFNPVNC
jgi:hypothetical protein